MPLGIVWRRNCDLQGMWKEKENRRNGRILLGDNALGGNAELCRDRHRTLTWDRPVGAPRSEDVMGKRCKNCDYGDCGDMCTYWRVWKKQVRFQFCSEAFVKELKESGARKYNILLGKVDIDLDGAHKIYLKHFPGAIR